MKKYICILLICLFIFCISACGKEEEIIQTTPESDEKEVEIVDITTPEPEIEEAKEESVPAEQTSEIFDEDHYNPDTQLVKFELGDGADIDYIMTDIIDKWDNFSVLRDDGNGVITYYIIPKDNGKSKGDSIATVKVYDDGVILREVTATVFLDEQKKHAEEVKKIYDYLELEFPAEFISNLNKDAWDVLCKSGEMDFERVNNEINSMKENETERFEHGNFNFEIAVESLSKAAAFSFYSK